MTAENDDDFCRMCGMGASDACSGCKGAVYCSKACQRQDWKTGHRALCRGPESNRKMNSVLRDLFQAEWHWLQRLSQSEKEELFLEKVLDTPLNHLFVGGEVALVLCRANACAVLTSTSTCTLDYGNEYYNKVLLPWYQRHMTFLSDAGFFLDYVSHGVFVSDRECACEGRTDGTRCGQLYDFARGGSAIIKDVRNPKIDLVNKIFGMQRSSYLLFWSEEDKANIKWKDLLECTSFRESKTADQETGTVVNYYFQHNKQVFGGKSNVCCSPCFELPFVVDPVDATALGEHFYRCYEGLAKLGFMIELVLVHLEDWPDKACAETWWAAAGKNGDTFQKWIDNDIALLSRRLPRYRLDRVVALVDKMKAARSWES